MVIEPIGTAIIFHLIVKRLNKREKIRTALNGSFVAGVIMLFFCIVWRMVYTLSEYFAWGILLC